MAKPDEPRLTAVKMYLERMLRNRRGNAFQDFFGDVMKARHGDGFQRGIALGKAGDLKCDGMLLDPRIIYACYGPSGGGAYVEGTIDAAAKKVASDYIGACTHWPHMVGWTFVSNFVEGVPPQVVHALDGVSAKAGKPVAYFGMESFLGTLYQLDDSEVEALLGPIATIDAFRNVSPDIVRQFVDRIASEFRIDFKESVAKPIPAEKFEINKIPACHAFDIRRGFAGITQVEEVVANSVEATQEGSLAAAFRARYSELKKQGLDPGQIVDLLYAFTIGPGEETSERRVAAWSLLAFLFERCTIFEDKLEDAA